MTRISDYSPTCSIHIISFIFIVLGCKSTFAQERSLDSICLNLYTQEFALNEKVPSNIQFESLSENDNHKVGLIVRVETLDNSYFFLSNWTLKRDTVSFTNRSGEETTEIWMGADFVRGNMLVIENNSDNRLAVPIEDNQLVLIQEAQDSEGNWRPIEYFIHSDCGLSYSSFGIPPHSYCQFMIAKYCGEFKTKMRVRILVHGEMSLSNEFEGSVNLKQFILSPSIGNLELFRNQLFSGESY